MHTREGMIRPYVSHSPVVQEGGYGACVLGINARHFFQGLRSGTYTLRCGEVKV